MKYYNFSDASTLFIGWDKVDGKTFVFSLLVPLLRPEVGAQCLVVLLEKSARLIILAFKVNATKVIHVVLVTKLSLVRIGISWVIRSSGRYTILFSLFQVLYHGLDIDQFLFILIQSFPFILVHSRWLTHHSRSHLDKIEIGTRMNTNSTMATERN